MRSVWSRVGAGSRTVVVPLALRPASKTAELILFCYGTTAADVVAYWSVEA